MAIPDPRVFQQETSPKSIFKSYGKNMGVVLAALETYDANRFGLDQVKIQVLYNLWKQCVKWLKLKAGKTNGSSLFATRKNKVENLRDEAFAELLRVSPKLAQALGRYEERKQGGNLGPGRGLQPGYDRERQIYENHNKTSGSSSSITGLDYVLRAQNHERRLQRFVQKGMGNLTPSEIMKIEAMYPDLMPPVLFLNKIARLEYIITTEGGLFYGGDDELILMQRLSFGKYALAMYAMDKYGNLYISTPRRTDYVHLGNDGYEVKQTTQWNHSSFLAGSDVVSAGCLHIGYNCQTQALQAGCMGAIDNNSGHYKPTTQNLMNCVHQLKQSGVPIDRIRVGDYSNNGDPSFYWGHHFLAGPKNAWPSENKSFGLLTKAPPIGTGAGLG